jgi:hypothetical protein
MEATMKKIIFAVVIIAAFAAIQPLYSQTISKASESEHYYVNVPLEKVYIGREGYVVMYRKGVNNLAKAYIPYEWFNAAAGKGELVTLPRGTNWPSLTIFYKSGEFSHIRLYIHRERGHTSWGIVPANANLSEHFKDVESIELEF